MTGHPLWLSRNHLLNRLNEIALHEEPFGYAHTDKMPSCYLSGPMTGLPDFNVISFVKGAGLLRDAGWTVMSPHEHDEDSGVTLYGHPTGNIAELEGFDFKKAMCWDLMQVLSTDVTFVMPGWEESTGGQLEVYVAHKVGKPVYTLLSQRKIEPQDGEEMVTGSTPGLTGAKTEPSGSSPIFGSSQEASLTSSQSANEGADRAGSAPSPLACFMRAYEAGTKIPGRHPNSARFHELVQEIGELHDRKQQDYGSDKDPFANVRASEEWGVPAWVGALVRLNDKVTRLKSFARKGSLANESAEDSMRDIAVYALIALVLYEQDSA